MQIATSLTQLDPFAHAPSSPSATSTACTAATSMVIANVLEPRPHAARPCHRRHLRPPPLARPAHRLTPPAHHAARRKAQAPRRHRPRPVRSSCPSTTNSATGPRATFAERVLRDTLSAVEVHEGETFRFGHGAEAGIEGLTALGHDLRLRRPRLRACTFLRGAPISSSRIRDLIALPATCQPTPAPCSAAPSPSSAPPPQAAATAPVYTVPTINLAPYADLLPANGVYITTLRIGNSATSQGKSSEAQGGRPKPPAPFRGVTNAGNRPTFGADSFAVETHLLDFEPITLTEETPLELTFLHRLRAEIRFDLTPKPSAPRSAAT